MSTGYARRWRESGSGGETAVMLEGFWVRNRFSERLVTKLRERGYYGRKADGQVCLGGAGI